jgi:hypothetical protein
MKYTRRLKSRPITLKNCVKLYLILLAGDVATNPGPVANPCGYCARPVAKTHRAVLCEACYYWWHIKCAGISPNEYQKLSKSTDPWICSVCNSFQFTDSFFSDIYIPDSENDGGNSFTDSKNDLFDSIKETRRENPNKFLCAYININSLRYKFCDIKELLTKNIVDLLFISETKLDDTFVDAQFQADNYHLWRADRDAHGGGIVAYLRSDLAGDRKKHLEFKCIESICVEVIIDRSKWLISGLYRPPSANDRECLDDMHRTIDQVATNYDNFVFLGDMNYDCLIFDKCKSLMEIFDVFDLTNVINEPTCFPAINNPSLLDIIFTNMPKNVKIF